MFYSPNIQLSINDSSWLCIILMVFAIGTQFAHLDKEIYGAAGATNSKNDGPSSVTDETVALSFYRKASTLIPDVMTAASIESVQAFMLLGVYTLPVDPDGLSCTYLSIDIKSATQDGLHLKRLKSMSFRDLQLRKLVWWAACTLERSVKLFSLPSQC